MPLVYVNERIKNDYQYVKSFADLGVKKKNYVHVIATGHGGASTVLAEKKQNAVVSEETRKDLPVKQVEYNIVQSAIARNPFYTFDSLKRYFPHLDSMREFITSDKYLGGLDITFQGNVYGLDGNKVEKLNAVLGLLSQIEAEVRQQIAEYHGSKEFRSKRIHEVFKNTILKFDKNNKRGEDDPQFEYTFSKKDWYVFNTLYGTNEEKPFVYMLDRQMEKLKEQYESIYLLRNESHFAIYDFEQGRPFQPDFVLFLREKSGKTLTYQLFIEPKGRFLQKEDKWKEEFLKQITAEFEGKPLKLEDKKYRLIGIPFYNNEDENIFKESLYSVLIWRNPRRRI